jgi:hypothetical protein
MKKISVGVAALCAAAGAAIAQPQLDLKYTVTDVGGGQYHYVFTLAPNAGWAPGMGWRWLIFGDEPGTCCGGSGISPFVGYVSDPNVFPVGPWTQHGFSSGGHNGPDMSFVLDFWVPSSATETLTWAGTVAANLQQGQLKWSTLAGTQGGATAADWTVAECTNCGVQCYPDCNGDTLLNLSDFGCFTTKFALGDPYADCNGDTFLNLSDFGCFTTKFALGCP